MSHILVIDDEEAVCWALQKALQREGHQVDVASSAEEGFHHVERTRPDAVILDVRLPGLDGLSALGKLRELTGNAPVIVATAYGNLTTAVRAVENGAFDYLAKPFDLDQALDSVQRALQRRALQTSARPDGSSDKEGQEALVEEFVARSPVMQNVFKRIALVAPRDSCVLITGESGTGKELVARAIHRHSSRRDKPFLPVHIGALNPNLVESELFGHVKGSFTGADQTRSGILALADQGTIFLDELGDIPMAVQVKLLRALEYGEVTPVGGKQPHRLHVRILAATHQDLAQKVSEGSFRHDLFFRLNVFQIHLPPLRERPEDIVPLAEYFLNRLEPRALPLMDKTVDFLLQQQWPGNVRELRNALEHAVIVAQGGPLLPEHFPKAPIFLEHEPKQALERAVQAWVKDRLARSGEKAPTELYQELLQCIEPVLLDEVMRELQGNRWAAAQYLGLNRATVRKKLAAYGLTDAHRPPGRGEPS